VAPPQSLVEIECLRGQRDKHDAMAAANRVVGHKLGDELGPNLPMSAHATDHVPVDQHRNDRVLGVIERYRTGRRAGAVVRSQVNRNAES
jgi:hypothetical protein